MPVNADALLAASAQSSKAKERRAAVSVCCALRWRICASSVLLGIGCCAFLTFLVGVPRREPSFASPMTTLVETEWGDASCYKNTGGTCHVMPCHPWRNATCGSGWNCHCDHGCVDANGTCHTARPELVAQNFTLQNMKWTNQYIQTKTTPIEDQLMTCAMGSWFGCVPERFNLYKLHGEATWTDEHPLRDFYFLQPTHRPNSMVGIASGIQMRAFLYSADGPVDPSKVMTSLCEPEKQKGAYQFAGIKKYPAYLSELSYKVFALMQISEAGDQALWKPDPPFAFDFNVMSCPS